GGLTAAPGRAPTPAGGTRCEVWSGQNGSCVHVGKSPARTFSPQSPPSTKPTLMSPPAMTRLSLAIFVSVIGSENPPQSYATLYELRAKAAWPALSVASTLKVLRPAVFVSIAV